MSLPPHREKDAKVEGRDQPETVKETMAPFRRLMRSLLKVKPEEVVEQEKRYKKARGCEAHALPGRKKRPRLKLPPTGDDAPNKSDNAGNKGHIEI